MVTKKHLKKKGVSIMRFPGSIGMILLAVYLIIVGLAALIPGFAIPSIVLGILALAAGILLLIGR